MLAHHLTGSGRTLVFLHGFTQTGSSWSRITDDLSNNFTCLTVDLPGHGGSPDGRRSLTETADDIARVITSHTESAIVVGYSMGARMALHVALAHPRLVTALVLVSGTAGITDDAERAARRRSDDILADRIESIGTEEFLAEWLAQPMFASLPRDSAAIEERLVNTPSGLADSLRHAGTGTQSPLWTHLDEITVPTLVVTGDLDRKFTDLGELLALGITTSTHRHIAGAGHTVHLEKPDEFIATFRRWLASLD